MVWLAQLGSVNSERRAEKVAEPWHWGIVWAGLSSLLCLLQILTLLWAFSFLVFTKQNNNKKKKKSNNNVKTFSCSLVHSSIPEPSICTSCLEHSWCSVLSFVWLRQKDSRCLLLLRLQRYLWSNIKVSLLLFSSKALELALVPHKVDPGFPKGKKKTKPRFPQRQRLTIRSPFVAVISGSKWERDRKSEILKVGEVVLLLSSWPQL